MTNTVLNDQYTLLVSCSDSNEILQVGMVSKGNNLNFALLSRYIFTAMGISEMDDDTFYKTFNLLSDNYCEYETIDGWEVFAITSDGLMTFAMRKADK